MKRITDNTTAVKKYPSRIIFLDEATTGLDVVTKRQIWKTIQKAKQDKVVVMTTHSMAEADALSDKIAIMAAGQIRAVGHSSELKSRFGQGYIIKVQIYKQFKEDLEQLLYQANPNIRIDQYQDIPSQQDQLIARYVIPPNNPISYIYDTLQEQKGKMLETFDIQFSSLEDVFLTISNMAEPLTKEEQEMMQI